MIKSLLVAVPKNVISRSSFYTEGFEKVTGIKKTRRWTASASELAMEAALAYQALHDTKGIGSLIVVTQSPDRKIPCMAMDIHSVLKLPGDVAAFDVNQSCPGFVYGVWLASQMKSDSLVVCVDKLRYDPASINSLLFSDGACVARVSPWKKGDPPAAFLTDPRGTLDLCQFGSGFLKMDGGKVFDFVASNVPGMVKSYVAEHGPFDFLAQHQANKAMMRTVESRTGFSGRSLECIEDFGNMSMVSVAATLAANEEKIRGKKVLLAGYGAGWSAALIGVKWPERPCATIWEV